MSGYGQFARVLAGIWLLVQMIILLDFIYDVNEWLLKKVSLYPNAVLCAEEMYHNVHRLQMASVAICIEGNAQAE